MHLEVIIHTDQGSMGQHVASQVAQYVIPEYQRPYSWDTPDWRVLWSDVLRQYEYVATHWDVELHSTDREENEAAVAEALVALPLHYMGTLVTANPMTVTPPRSTVVDGQQRILTFLVLLLAVRDNLLSKGGDSESIRARYSSLLSNHGLSGNARLRVKSQDADRKAYEYLLDPGRPLAPRVHIAALPLHTSDSSQLIKVYNYFRRELARTGLPLNPPFELEAYRHLYGQGVGLDPNIIEFVVMTRLFAIKLIADANDDPNMIFESLNTKGRPLQQVDLIKNFLYLSLGAKAGEIYRAHWRPMEQLLKPLDLEKFAWAYLVSAGDNILQKRTYEAVQRRLRSKKAWKVQQFVAGMESESVQFARLLNPEKETNPFVRTALKDVLESGGATALPMLLYCYRRFHDGAPLEDFLGALKLIESFLVRRMLAGRFTNNLNSFFGSMCFRLYNDTKYYATGNSLREDIARVLSSFQSEWPDDIEVSEGILNNDFYHNQHSEQRVRVLRALDQYYNTSGVHVDYPLSDKTIEHVVPQDEKAPDWLAARSDPSVSERTDALANLTLLPPHQNSSLGNKGWRVKVAVYRESPYHLTSRIAEMFGERPSWGATELSERAKDLAAAACAIWPRELVEQHKAPEAVPAVEDDFDDEIDDSTSLLDQEVAEEALAS